MGYPIRDRESGGGRDFNRDRGVRRPQMHKAICSSCGKECDLPFKPTGDRPVYCRECFARNGGGERKESFNRDNRDTRDARENRDFPRPPFKSFNNDGTGPRPQPHAAPHTHHDEQFAAINTKLDRLITLLTPKTSAPQVKNVAKAVEIAEELAEVEREMVKKKKTTKKKAKTSKK